MVEKIILLAPKGANRNKKQIGRGVGTGHGGTACRGDKGQNARSGGGVRPGFEGGQMPLYRRVARRGFSNCPFKKTYNIINIEDLGVFKAGDSITKDSLKAMGLIHANRYPVKILGRGELTIKLNVKIDKISKSAKDKIEKAGGAVEILEEAKKEAEK
ncbi:MAG: 50S ribosomal protein L15 [Spirochaetales bacterium]|nr:50S ribosomal protein L15 [Spirochaetales bacterium]